MRSLLLLLALALTACPPSSNDDDSSSDDDDATDDDDSSSDDDDDSAPSGVTRGYCPLDQRIGRVSMSHEPPYDISIWAKVYEEPNPQIGEPTLTNTHCQYHGFGGSGCGECAADEVCAFDLTCQPAPVAALDLVFDVTVDGQTQTVPPSNDGLAFAQIATEAVDPSVDISLAWGEGNAIEVAGLQVPRGDIQPQVSLQGDSCSPGALSASWTDLGNQAFVSTWININHHVIAPTFTRCTADESDGTWTATEPMIVPLSVVTGLEFQGLDYEQAWAAWTEDGCVEVVATRRLYVWP